jgi:hypothetical protein
MQFDGKFVEASEKVKRTLLFENLDIVLRTQRPDGSAIVIGHTVYLEEVVGEPSRYHGQQKLAHRRPDVTKSVRDILRTNSQ